MNFLWSEWQRLWAELHGKQEDAREVFEKLVSCYNESHREYHTLDHIEYCLRMFATVRQHSKHSVATEYAIWCHDAIYNVRAKDNEVQSGELLLDIAMQYHLEGLYAIIAHKCVKDTAHEFDPIDIDRRIMVDVDRAILGESWEVYAKYAAGVRKEYGHIPTPIYNFARRRYMRTHFLTYSPIFTTSFMRERYELQARANIERELGELGWLC
ncbi:MAG: hypothetical protein NT003_00385 [Candidatus Magasanikbacteria bacterium]|nr:hypothetical protein [Candidatus Magasanikbacteria bacterium]